MKSHAEGWVPGFQCPKVSEERGAGSGPFLEGTGLEDVMLRGSVQSGRFEASGKVLEGPEPGCESVTLQPSLACCLLFQCHGIAGQGDASECPDGRNR